MVLMAGRVFFLTQFIKSYGCLFEEAISYIFLSKNLHLASLIFDLKAFQSTRSSHWQYLLRLFVYFWFHYSLECLVIYLGLEYLVYVFLYTRDN